MAKRRHDAASNSHTWNGSKTVEKEWGFDVDVTVPPHTVARVTIIVSKTTITLPYRLNGFYEFGSGQKIPATIHGLYKGTNSHDIEVITAGGDGQALPGADAQIIRAVRV